MATSVNIYNLSGAALEKALADKLEDLLKGIPWLRGWKVECLSFSKNPGFGIQATLPLPGGGKVALCIECKREIRPATFRLLASKKLTPIGRPKIVVPVLALPWVSPGVAEACKEQGWSWYDLAGNHSLDVPGAYRLERLGNKPLSRPPGPKAGLGTLEAARIVRALLLRNPVGRKWTQHELRDACRPEVSIGLVNKIVRYLREEDILEPCDGRGFRVREPLKLLTNWREVYRIERHATRLSYFTLKHGKSFQEALESLGAQAQGKVVFGVFTAAEKQAPHVRQSKTWFYVEAHILKVFEMELQAKSVDTGENIIVLIPSDEGVFLAEDESSLRESRIGCTSLIQTYVDLYHAGGRGEEAAEALLEQRIKIEWKRQGFKV